MSLSLGELQLQIFQYASDLRKLINLNDHLTERESALYRLFSHLNEPTSAFSIIFQNDIDMHILSDVKGRILSCNSAAILIAPRHSLSGSLVEEWIAECDRECFKQIFNEITLDRSLRSDEISVKINCISKTQHVVSVSIYACAITEANGLTAIHWVIREINNRSTVSNTISEKYFKPHSTYQKKDLQQIDNSLKEKKLEFKDHAQIVHSWAEKTGNHFSILTIDVKGLGEIENSREDQNGTILVQRIKQRLSYGLRDSDILTRVSEDRFLVLLKGISGDWNISEVCKKLLLAFATPVVIGTTEFDLEGLIGCSEYPRHGRTLDNLIENSKISVERITSNQVLKYEIFERVFLGEE